MKKWQRFIMKFGGLISAFALVITAAGANQVCYFIVGQDRPPESARRLRKF